jgi:hypothetical protein
VHISEVAVAAAITASLAGVSYAAFNTDALTEPARTVADEATCRAVDDAIVAYLARYDAAPHRIADVAPYVRGDISAYRIEDGLAAGPGCEPTPAR